MKSYNKMLWLGIVFLLVGLPGLVYLDIRDEPLIVKDEFGNLSPSTENQTDLMASIIIFSLLCVSGIIVSVFGVLMDFWTRSENRSDDVKR